mmetsp:Transcript_38481/g.64771  ORF Transcript_38481/g.64771 Transcript_38481/m.64771 type:complete len:247 (+) Transcript_38481:1030-1770(+)
MPGIITPSPMPTNTLDVSTIGSTSPPASPAMKVCDAPSAIGSDAQASAKTMIPTSMTFLPPNLSANEPPSNCVLAYPHKKLAWIMPCVEAVQPNWSDMGMMATDMQMRQMFIKSRERPQPRTTAVCLRNISCSGSSAPTVDVADTIEVRRIALLTNSKAGCRLSFSIFFPRPKSEGPLFHPSLIRAPTTKLLSLAFDPTSRAPFEGRNCDTARLEVIRRAVWIVRITSCPWLAHGRSGKQSIILNF